jgi:hypothetical protein
MASHFRKGFTKVRRTVKLTLTADYSFNIPATAEILKVYLRRTSTADTTTGVRIGTAAAGAQIVALTPLATQNLPVVATLVANGIAVAAQTLYISAAGWNSATVDVVVEYAELGDSLPLASLTTGSYAGGQQSPSAT